MLYLIDESRNIQLERIISCLRKGVISIYFFYKDELKKEYLHLWTVTLGIVVIINSLVMKKNLK